MIHVFACEKLFPGVILFHLCILCWEQLYNHFIVRWKKKLFQKKFYLTEVNRQNTFFNTSEQKTNLHAMWVILQRCNFTPKDFFYLIFTLDKAEQQRKGMELKEDVEEKDIKHIGKMFW